MSNETTSKRPGAFFHSDVIDAVDCVLILAEEHNDRKAFVDAVIKKLKKEVGE